MADSFYGTISLGLAGRLNHNPDLGNAYQTIDQTYQNIFANGILANQANQMWSDTRTLTASSTENLDMSGTSLQNAFGTNIAFTGIKAIIISASSSNTNNVLVGGDTNSVPFCSATNDVVVVKPGGLFLVTAPTAAGFAVTAGTGDIIKVANSSSGTSVTYDIIVIGITA